ncbi:hypothetical protein MMC15_000096 [Xylographa vitiligo]|nr:hypothetical protein [Xylographa vitiligo]
MQSYPAFTAVPARRALTRPGPVPPPQFYRTPPPDPPKPDKPKREWPLAVRLYVQRSFAAENSIADIGREEMELRLKKVISDAAESNTLHTVDWDNLPLPQQMIQAERMRIHTINTSLTSAWRDLSTLNVQETNGISNESLSKKRKSSDLAHGQNEQENLPPWRNTNTGGTFEDRLTYADKRQRNDLVGKTPSKSQFNLESRKRRFEGGENGSTSTHPNVSTTGNPQMPDVEQGPVVGTCEKLEKKYFRLTSAPNPATVRPLPVLEKTLDLLKKKWKSDNNYSYICDQFKSLRQDLTVQHIRNDFTVNVYEIHARIALEKGDLGEYNQCQTQLRVLYSSHLGGHPMEFKAYRILYFIHTRNRTEMNDVLADLTPAEKKAPSIKHALDSRSALALGNYHRFFQLYLETPNMGAYLMDMFVSRERLAALTNICKAYKPDVKLRFITEELGFESDEESARFLCDQGGQAFLEEREDGVRLLSGKVGNIFEAVKDAAFRKVDIKGQI